MLAIFLGRLIENIDYCFALYQIVDVFQNFFAVMEGTFSGDPKAVNKAECAISSSNP
jgi:hypothetical protein